MSYLYFFSEQLSTGHCFGSKDFMQTEICCHPAGRGPLSFHGVTAIVSWFCLKRKLLAYLVAFVLFLTAVLLCVAHEHSIFLIRKRGTEVLDSNAFLLYFETSCAVQLAKVSAWFQLVDALANMFVERTRFPKLWQPCMVECC